MSETLSPKIERAIADALAAFKPEPRLLVSEWAGSRRYLSAEASAEPGLWNNARAPHLVKPMDCLRPYHPASRVVCKFSSQTGKTEVILNFCGYIIDCSPGPTLAIQPNVSPMGEAFSKDRIAPMLRDSPTLREKAGPGSSRSSANTITHKSFPNGHLTIAGGNSVAGLASRPIRYLVGDEIDRWEPTKEGDPLLLSRKRLQTFRVRRTSKELLVSSPTYSDVGICVEYDKCSQQWEWHLVCEHCGESQFPRLKHFMWTERNPKTVRYACEHCGSEHALGVEDRVKARGLWVLVKSGPDDSIGFTMNQWASPFARWDDTVEEWLSAGNDPLQKQAVTNTVFAEPWDGEGDRIDPHILEQRAEDYPAEVPAGVRAITIGVDVQIDRMEAEIVGWGEGETSWSIAYEILPGEPTSEYVWVDLEKLFRRTWAHEQLVGLRPKAMCIDSGNWSKNVYEFVKRMRDPRIIPIKGSSVFGADILAGTKKDRRLRMVKRMLNGRPPEILGVSQMKRILAKRLVLPLDAPGCCHFPVGRGREYYDQLTGERLVAEKKRGQRPRMAWQRVHANVEALDARNYAYAALLLSDADLSKPVRPIKEEKSEAKRKKIEIGKDARRGLL